jgi:hypothetical protein
MSQLPFLGSGFPLLVYEMLYKMTLTAALEFWFPEFQSETKALYVGGSVCESLGISVFQMIFLIHSCVLAFVFPGGLMDVAESCAGTARIPCD